MNTFYVVTLNNEYTLFYRHLIKERLNIINILYVIVSKTARIGGGERETILVEVNCFFRPLGKRPDRVNNHNNVYRKNRNKCTRHKTCTHTFLIM